MGIWARLIRRQEKYDTLDFLRALNGGRESSSGVNVTWETALGASVVLACCRVVANGVAQVPFKVFRDVDGDRVSAGEHPLGKLLRRRPNPWQTSFEFREMLTFHLELTGNAFVFLNKVGSDRRIAELIPLDPAKVTVERDKDFTLTYKVSGDDGETQTFPADAIWHLRGPSWNSWMGMDAVKLAKDVIGLNVSLEDSQANFLKGGAQSSGVLSMKNKLSPERYEFLAKWLDMHAPGGTRFGKPMIADDDAKFTSTVMSHVDAQLLESRKFQIEEYCRMAGVMPIMVGYSDKAATYASAEQMFLAHVVHGLSPRYARIEQSADVNLLSEPDLDAGFYTKFVPNALMRGAANDRAEFYSKALGSGGSKGWMTQNDVRRLEELPRSSDPEADVLPQQANSSADSSSDGSRQSGE